MMMMNIEVISREIIKPSSPTPHHLRTFNLSFLDQIAPPIYVPIIHFYANEGHDGKIKIFEQQRCLLLKKSLSETLNKFYPVAGRIKEDFCIDCNDMGVDFFEARVHGLLSDVIKQPNSDLLKQFLPCDSESKSCFGSGSEVLLAIQVNVFDCGGLAVGVCISHKIADASSLTTFVNHWAATTCGSTGAVGPHFELASLFPQRDLGGGVFKANIGIRREKIVTKRFLFDASSIATLRAKSSQNSSVENPTRVEAVTAFIWKRFMDVVEAKRTVMAYAMFHAVNLRGRIVPPLPLNSFGNMYSVAIAPLKVEMEKEGHDLLARIRNAIREIDGEYVKKLQSSDWFLKFAEGVVKKISKGETLELLNFSSWCRCPLYEADFGWGKPIWVSTTTLPFKNVVIFMDTRSGDGIEAWINMLEDDMAEFEGDQEILAFASSNPTTL